MAKKKGKRQQLRQRVGQRGSFDAGMASIRGDLRTLQKLAMQGVTVPLSRIPNVPSIDPKKWGKTAADLQFGEAIRELSRGITGQSAQGAQNLSDIGSWYGDVRARLEAARGADVKSNAAALAEQAASDQGIIEALGGGASPAAAAVGQTAAQNQAMLRGLGAATSSYDEAAIGQLSAEAAGQQLRQSRIDQNRMAELQNELGDVRMKRGAVAAQSEMEAMLQNFQNRQSRFQQEMGAREFNQNVRGQRFSQRAAIPALRMSASMADVERLGAEANALNAIDAPTMGGGGGGTPRLANGLTPYQQASLELRGAQAGEKAIQARAKQISATRKDVRQRREKYFDDLTGALSATDAEGRRVVQGAENAASKAVALARARGLDLRKPEVRNLVLDAIGTSVTGFDRRRYMNLIMRYGNVPIPKGKPKPVSQRRRSGR